MQQVIQIGLESGRREEQEDRLIAVIITPGRSHISQANRIVPFSQPQASMGMRPRPRLTTTTTTRRPRITTRRTTLLELATTTTAPDLRERIAQEVVDMDAHGLAEAIHDPMMMGLAAIVISAGMSLLDNAPN